MTVLACLILLALALLCLWRQKVRAGFRLIVVVFFLFLLIGTGLVPQTLLSRTQILRGMTAGDWKEHNSIVLLGAGTLPPSSKVGARIPFFGFSRVAAAAQAYFACRSRSGDCKVIVSGGDPQGHGQSEAAVYSRGLLALHVPPEDLQLEGRSKNTWQNASEATKLAGPGRVIVVVTSGFQLKRALLYFSHFRAGVRGISSDELDVDVGPVPSGMNFLITDILLHEQIGIARYYVYNALGLNVPKSA